jgi:hypothetical protein
MLMPLYPFDTPLDDNPYTLNDMPAARWRMPYHDSVDGYQVQVARDAAFTQIVETWETYETRQWPFYGVIPATFRSQKAYEDNESYYWRVRIRHERYQTISTYFDYGPWSPAFRFKLAGRQTANVSPPDGTTVGATPTFTWDRMEGDGSYQIQVDDDANFSSPLINKAVDGTSFTPTTAFRDGVYYWRVAMRRSASVIGRWSERKTFTKTSEPPAPVSPVGGVTLNAQPVFTWEPWVANRSDLRLAAPRYKLQVAADPAFSVPDIIYTQSASYALRSGESLADGAWYWRVAVIDGAGQQGSYSDSQTFYKEYLPPVLLSPVQGSAVQEIPSFAWAPLAGAAYYRIQIADNPLFNRPTTATTDNTRYTPVVNLAPGVYYWRVQMLDDDGKVGPYQVGRVAIQEPGFRLYLPLMAR